MGLHKRGITVGLSTESNEVLAQIAEALNVVPPNRVAEAMLNGMLEQLGTLTRTYVINGPCPSCGIVHHPEYPDVCPDSWEQQIP